MAIGSLVFWIRRRRGHDLFASRWAMRLAMLAGPAAVLTLELGWITTEVGRHRGSSTACFAHRRGTDNNGVWISLATLVVVYTVMGVVAVRVVRSMSARWRAGESDDLPTPYGPVAT